MDQESFERSIASRSQRIYLPLALGSAALFFAATLLADYTWVARIGGAVWVGILTLIISMPVVTSRVRRRIR